MKSGCEVALEEEEAGALYERALRKLVSKGRVREDGAYLVAAAAEEESGAGKKRKRA